jgi:ferredoxin
MQEFPMNQVSHVWVEAGCICCQACVTTLPEVFCFPDDRAEIRGEVRCDGRTSPNEDERSVLNAAGFALAKDIVEAAAGCPVEVIHFSAA